jgi:basic membrane protein A
MRRPGVRLVAFVAVLGLVAAGCGDDGTGTTGAPSQSPADFNGDGVVRIGVATDGPRDDGGYYQALVDKVEEISAAEGFEPPIVVDEIDPAESRTELENLAQQDVDIIAVGSENVARDNEDLFTTYDDIFWYCNCGSGYQDTPGLLRSADSGAELNISAGYAAGLLLEASGGDSFVFLGCCDLPFETESFLGFEFGLHQVNPDFTVTYVPTGTAPYDFNNVAGATEAYHNAVAEGADGVYPFLGGAANVPIARLAAADGLIVSTAGSSKGCERSDVDYSFEVKFDAGDYVGPIFEDILSGNAVEGGVRRFTVGIDPEVGAGFCHATPEQIQMLDDFNTRIGAGEFADEIDRILAEAYGS